MISFLVCFSLSLRMVLPPDREWLRTNRFLFLKQNANLSPGILPDKTDLCHWIPYISLNLWFFRWPESFHVLLSLPGTFSRLLLQVSLYFYLTNFVGVELIHNVVLVSAVQPSESVTHTSTEHSLLLRNLPWISKPRFRPFLCVSIPGPSRILSHQVIIVYLPDSLTSLFHGPGAHGQVLFLVTLSVAEIWRMRRDGVKVFWKGDLLRYEKTNEGGLDSSFQLAASLKQILRVRWWSQNDENRQDAQGGQEGGGLGWILETGGVTLWYSNKRIFWFSSSDPGQSSKTLVVY